MTEELFMSLLYCLPLLFKVWQRSGSCCCCYIVYHWCLRFHRGVVHVVFAIFSTITGTDLGLTEEWFMSLLYCLPLLCKVWQRNDLCRCYIVYHCCLRFDRGVVNVVVFYIVYHWCFRFHRGVVHVVFAIFSTITGTDLGLTEEWLMSLLYCLPLLF